VTHDGLAAPPRLITLGGANGLSLTVMDIGATWISCRVPLADGSIREVLLGHPTPADYLTEPGYLGAIIGRYANRIAGARFMLDGHTHRLTPNEGPHQLHGGPEGFNRRRWRVAGQSASHVRFALASPAGDQGFPGALDASVEYRIERPDTLSITLEADVGAPCPVNLTSHAYFNLDAAHHDASSHRLRIAAANYLPIGRDLIPTGEIAPVEGTPFDWRAPRPIGERLHEVPQQQIAKGYDHCFVLEQACANAAIPAAELQSSDARLTMSLYTSYPGLQFYSGNHLDQTRARDGKPYAPHAGIALEPQYFPDSPNHPEWPQPSSILRPGERRTHVIRIRFAPSGRVGPRSLTLP
jgi:aldose 1-epimerase